MLHITKLAVILLLLAIGSVASAQEIPALLQMGAHGLGSAVVRLWRSSKWWKLKIVLSSGT